MTLNRRLFVRSTAAAAAVLSAPMVHATGQSKPKVVVVGGGAGGATAARYVAKDSKGEIDVTLIEPSRKYYTCFFPISILAVSKILKTSAIHMENWRLLV